MVTSVVIVLITIGIIVWLDASKSEIILKILEWFPAILFAYVIPAAITHLFGLDLATGSIHSWSHYHGQFLIPVSFLDSQMLHSLL